MRLLKIMRHYYAVEQDGYSWNSYSPQPFRVEVRWDLGAVEVNACQPERAGDPNASRDGYGGELQPLAALAAAGLLVVAALLVVARRAFERVVSVWRNAQQRKGGE